MAKTYHYWAYHMPASPWTDVAAPSELLEPALPSEALGAADAYNVVVDEVRRGIRETTGWPTIQSPYLGWVGVQCADVEMAVWLLRALVVENVMVRREDKFLYLPASRKFQERDEFSRR